MQNYIVSPTSAFIGSSQQLEFLLNILSDAAAFFDKTGNYQMANPNWIALHDLIPNSFIGQSYGQTNPLLPDWENLFSRASATEALTEAEATMQRKDGELHHLECKLIPWRSTAGAEIEGLVVFISDTTMNELATLNQAREYAEQMARLNAELSIAISEKQILAAVARVAEQYGVARSALVYSVENQEGKFEAGTVVALRTGDGKEASRDSLPLTVFTVADHPLLKIVHESPQEVLFIENGLTDPRCEAGNARPYMQRTGEFGLVVIPLKVVDVWQGVITLAWKDPQTYSLQLRNLFNEVRPIVAAVAASHRLRVKLEENLRRLIETDRLKDEFLSNMSHELRTPLNAVIGLSDVILSGLDGEISERVETDIQKIFEGGQQLLSIVNDVLDIAKIEAGIVELIVKPTELLYPIMDAVSTVRAAAEAKRLNLVINDGELAKLPLVKADRNRIRQIVINLLGNAVKFTTTGTVELTASSTDEEVVICVRDEGMGIAQEYHALVFERFRQVEGSMSRRKGGAGLGLPISKGLVELHGGRMWLESEVGKGAKFFFSLPITASKSL